MESTQIYWLHTLSPTHVGTGRGVGYIDLPIHRDKVTGWPLIPGSAFKGVWADYYRATEDNRRSDPKLGLAFGRASDQETNASNAGALNPTDARLVCLPVRSFQGTFAWCTSPLALQMLRRDILLTAVLNLPPDQPTPADGDIHHTTTTKLKDGRRIFLEDLDFEGKECATATAWARRLAEWIFPGEENSAWRERFVERFAVVPDAIFDFLTETGMEVCARVRIDDDLKTVAWQGYGRARARALRLHAAYGGSPMTVQTNTQRMAQVAYQRIVDRKPDREFASFARTFPSLVHSCGLAQAVAFAKAKSRSEYLQDLVAVLNATDHSEAASADSFERATREDSVTAYVRLSRNALQAAGWLKRYVEAVEFKDKG